MSNIKVKIRFDDINNTTFEYDRIHGFNSLNILNESKTDVNLDYSVKSSTGTFSAKDIVSSKGYIDEFMKTFQIKDIEDIDGLSHFKPYGIYFDKDSDSFYFSNCTQSSLGDYIYKSKDLINFDVFCPNTLGNMILDKIVKFGEYFIATGAVKVDNVDCYGYIYVDSFGNSISRKLFDPYVFTDIPITYCLKEVNSKLFISIGNLNEMKHFYLESVDGEIKELPIYFPSNISQYQDIFDVIYDNETYYFLTRAGIYSSKDLNSFDILFSNEIYMGTKSASIIKHNDTFYFTTGLYSGKIYKTQDFKTYTYLDLGYVIYKIINVNNVLFLSTSSAQIFLYGEDFDKLNVITLTNSQSLEFSDIAFSGKQICITSSNSSTNYIVFSEQTDIPLKIYNSLYNFLISKPKYKNIYIDVLLDNKSISNFINNGSIQYDTESKTFSIGIQNNIVMLQNKKFKKQIDTANINNNYSAYDLYTELSSIASEIIGQNFEIDNETKTYMQNMIISYPYLEEDTIWEQLNKLCVLCQLSIYPKNNKIIVQRWV